MSIWNKILAGLVIVTSMVFFYFAVRTLKTHQVWRDSIRKHEAAMTTAADLEHKLVYGDPADGTPGIRQLTSDLRKINLARGRVWKNTQPVKVDPATGAVSVRTQLAAPHQDAAKTHLFVFQQPDPQGPQGATGAYLGDFVVTAVADMDWQIQPTRPMWPRELSRLQAAGRGLWIMYEKMPSPDPEFLALFGEQAPPAAGGPASAPEGMPKPDPAAAPAKFDVKAYTDQLVDYRQLFDDYYAQRSMFRDLEESLTNDLKSLNTALAAAQAEVAELKKDKDEFNAELAEMTRQHDAVAVHLKAVDGKVAEMTAKVNDLLAWNQAAATEIARLQLEAARRIDDRIRRVVRTTAGP